MHKNMKETTSKLQNQLVEIEGLDKQKERGTIGNEKKTGQKEKKASCIISKSKLS